MEKKWIPIGFDYKEIQKNKHRISEIINGKKPVLIIRNFYTVNQCKLIAIQSQRFLRFNQKDKIHKKIGTSLLSFLTSKSEYFKDADDSREVFRTIFEKIEDPRKKIHKLLSEFYPNKNIQVASEEQKKYACGVIRIHEFDDYAPIHRDCVSFEDPHFQVSKFINQLSTVLYLQQSDKGGDLVIYKKAWQKSDEKFRNIDFGYSRNVLKGCKESVKIKPSKGDLIIINPKYYHEILPIKSKKKRITLGLFLAFSDYTSHIVTWS